MRSVLRPFGLGLLWLAFSALSYAAPMLVNFDLGARNYGIISGGRFDASINGGSIFDVWCVDYRNEGQVDPAYPAYISDAGDISKTRYGTTAAANFTYAPGINAVDRYAMAGWLITQFSYPADLFSPAADNDRAIQLAIWSLLNAQPAPALTYGPYTPLIDTWLTAAVNFKDTNPTGFSDIKNAIRVVTDATVDGTVPQDRYTQGNQEMMYLVPGSPDVQVPEPSTYLLLGSGFFAMVFIARRRQRRQG